MYNYILKFLLDNSDLCGIIKNVENRWIDDSSQRIRCINSYNPPTAIGGLLLFVIITYNYTAYTP